MSAILSARNTLTHAHDTFVHVHDTPVHAHDTLMHAHDPLFKQHGRASHHLPATVIPIAMLCIRLSWAARYDAWLLIKTYAVRCWSFLSIRLCQV